MIIHCQNEPIATNTVYSNTPGIGSGVTSAQIFIGMKSLFVTNIYRMKTDKQFVNTFEDVTKDQGARTKLVSG